MPILIRITRHELDAEREAFLKGVFGDDLRIIPKDIPYGDSPVSAVRDLLGRVEAETGDKVVAVDAVAPFPILIKLVDGSRDLGVPFIRSTFKRDEGGRAIVIGKEPSGRDILAFGGYEKLVRIIFETQPLLPITAE